MNAEKRKQLRKKEANDVNQAVEIIKTYVKKTTGKDVLNQQNEVGKDLILIANAFLTYE